MKTRDQVRLLLKEHLSAGSRHRLRKFIASLDRLRARLLYPYARFIATPIRLRQNRKRSTRYLEIGPGQERIRAFETINVVWTPGVDYIGDASGALPFKSETFDVVYASHVLEHIPWYMTSSALREWVRILKPGGSIEVWVPNGLLIAQTFVNAELGIRNEIERDGWFKFNATKDPCAWANGRIFSYGDGTGRKADPNWHMALFSPRYLRKLLSEAGLKDIETLERTEVRGYDHGWINLGMRGRKK